MGMTKTRRNQYSKQFKAEAVELVLLTGRPNVEVAAELGINAGTLGNWVNQWKRENPEAEPEMTPRDMARLEAVEEELRAVKLENEFLKKPPSSRRRWIRCHLRVYFSGEGKLSGGLDVPIAFRC